MADTMETPADKLRFRAILINEPAKENQPEGDVLELTLYIPHALVKRHNTLTPDNTLQQMVEGFQNSLNPPLHVSQDADAILEKMRIRQEHRRIGRDRGRIQQNKKLEAELIQWVDSALRSATAPGQPEPSGAVRESWAGSHVAWHYDRLVEEETGKPNTSAAAETRRKRDKLAEEHAHGVEALHMQSGTDAIQTKMANYLKAVGCPISATVSERDDEEKRDIHTFRFRISDSPRRVLELVLALKADGSLWQATSLEDVAARAKMDIVNEKPRGNPLRGLRQLIEAEVKERAQPLLLR